VENACAALALAGVEGLFTRGPAVPRSRIHDTASVETVDWVDHDEVMPLCDVVVTHGGLGTTLRALAHGRPLLILPLGRDQHFNASRVAELGAGLTLRSDAPAAQIAEALTRLYADSTYREVASELAAAIALERPDTRAAEVLSGLVLR